MTTTNDTNLMTSAQVRRRLHSINASNFEIKKKLLNLVEKFQYLDHIAKSAGLIKKGFSFANRVSWKNVFSSLEKPEESENKTEDIKLKDIIDTISHSSNQLEHELIPQLQKLRNNWMFKVILIEFAFLSSLLLAIVGFMYLQGLSALPNINTTIQSFLYERPIFSFIIVIILFIGILLMHFSIRKFVASKLASKIKKESAGFDFANAFLKNTRLQHSIFRPDVIGWNSATKKRLQKI